MKRIFLILHDHSDNSDCDPYSLLKRVQSRFPNIQSRLLIINSIPPDAPNLHQPDMWSHYLIPTFFPRSTPTMESLGCAEIPKNPLTGSPALGCRLSIEDFMSVRDFCIEIFKEEVIPCIEKKIAFLSKQVNDARKGVKNVFKSFWRKPKDDAEVTKGSVKYKYDKIESQILRLADLSFIIHDYETAMSLYKLVKDDFKADKSYLHLAHTTVMITACHVILGSTANMKDIMQQLENLGQIFAVPVELPHSIVYYSVIMAEFYVCNAGYRTLLEAARVLLHA